LDYKGNTRRIFSNQSLSVWWIKWERVGSFGISMS